MGELLRPLMRGGSVSTAQRQALAAKEEGAKAAGTDLMASLGAKGKFPNNAERDLHCKIRRALLIDVPIRSIHLTIVDLRATRVARQAARTRKKRSRRELPIVVVKTVDYPVIYPHEMFAAIMNSEHKNLVCATQIIMHANDFAVLCNSALLTT
jgi:hypothetical protein